MIIHVHGVLTILGGDILVTPEAHMVTPEQLMQAVRVAMFLRQDPILVDKWSGGDDRDALKDMTIDAYFEWRSRVHPPLRELLWATIFQDRRIHVIKETVELWKGGPTWPWRVFGAVNDVLVSSDELREQLAQAGKPGVLDRLLAGGAAE